MVAGWQGVFLFRHGSPTESYTLSLHDALPISPPDSECPPADVPPEAPPPDEAPPDAPAHRAGRSEEHTSELQSRRELVCRLLLEKKKPSRRVRTSLACPRTSSSRLDTYSSSLA